MIDASKSKWGHNWRKTTQNVENEYFRCPRCEISGIRLRYGSMTFYTAMENRGLTCDEVIVRKIHET